MINANPQRMLATDGQGCYSEELFDDHCWQERFSILISPQHLKSF